MGKVDKLLLSILQANSDQNISFGALCNLLERYGFNKRVKGDHFIFTKDDIVEIINIQPNGNKAKAYQVKQIRNLITHYKLGNIDE